MNIKFDIPHEVGRSLRGVVGDINREAKEAFLVEQFRQGRVTRYQLEVSLGLDAYATGDLLAGYGFGGGSAAAKTEIPVDRATLIDEIFEQTDRKYGGALRDLAK